MNMVVMTFLTIISREVETWVLVEIRERRLIERDALFFYENVKKGEEQSERFNRFVKKIVQ